MALKPEVSIPTAAGVAVLVYAIHQNATPTIADVRAARPDNADLQAAERSATWLSAGVVAGISLIAKDPTIFVIGGAAVIGMAWWTRHADLVNPATGKATLAMIRPEPVTQQQGAYAATPDYAIG